MPTRVPCVGAIVRIAGVASASLHLAEGCEAPARHAGQHIDDVFVMRLVI